VANLVANCADVLKSLGIVTAALRRQRFEIALKAEDPRGVAAENCCLDLFGKA
jgi:hypothetical protein